MTSYILRSVAVDSRDRVNTTDTQSNFTVNLVQGFGKAKKIQLQSAEIPVANWTITNNNNTFQLIEGANPAVNVSLSTGSPSATALVTDLSSVLSAASPGGIVYTAIYNINHNTISIDTTPATNFSLTFGQNSPYVQLGFNVGTIGPGTSITSPNVFNLSGINNYFIRITNIPTNNSTSNSNTYTFKIPITVAPFSTNIYTNFSQWNQIIDYGDSSPVDISTLSVRLTDYYNNLVDLNGNDWSFTMTIYQ